MPAFSNLVEQMFESFVTVITGLGEGLRAAFDNLIYVDAAATNPEFSPLVVFLFVAGGIAVAMGLLYKVFGIIRGVAHK